MLASVTTAARGSVTLGVAAGPRQFFADQLLATSSGPCMNGCSCATRRQNFALLHDSLGIRRITHILRVHGHTHFQGDKPPKIFDEVGQRSLERLFSRVHAGQLGTSRSVRQAGVGCKRVRDVASPVHMIQDAASAGLIPNQPLLPAMFYLGQSYLGQFLLRPIST